MTIPSQLDERSEGLFTLSSPFEAPEYQITVSENNVLQFYPPPQSEALGSALSYHFPEEETLVAKMQAATKKWMTDRIKKGNASTDMGNPGQALSAAMTGPSKGANDEQPSALEIAADLSVESTREKIRIRQQDSQNPSAKTASIKKVPSPDSLDSSLKVNRKGDTKSGGSRGNQIPGVRKWKLGSVGGTKMVPKKRQYTKKEKEEIGKNRGNVCQSHKHRKQKCDPALCPENKLYNENLSSSSLNVPSSTPRNGSKESITFASDDSVVPSQIQSTLTGSRIIDYLLPGEDSLNSMFAGDCLISLNTIGRDASYQQTNGNRMPNDLEQGLSYPYISPGVPSNASTQPDIVPPDLVSDMATPGLVVSSLNTPLPDNSAQWTGNIQDGELSEGTQPGLPKMLGEYPAVYDTPPSVWPEFGAGPHYSFYPSGELPKVSPDTFSIPKYSAAAEYYSTDVELSRKEFYASHPQCRHTSKLGSYEPCLCYCEFCCGGMFLDQTSGYYSTGIDTQPMQQRTMSFPPREISRGIAELDPWEPSIEQRDRSISYPRTAKESVLSKLVNKANWWKEKSREIPPFSALRRLPGAVLRGSTPPTVEKPRVDINTDVDDLTTALKSSTLV